MVGQNCSYHNCHKVSCTENQKVKFARVEGLEEVCHLGSLGCRVGCGDIGAVH